MQKKGQETLGKEQGNPAQTKRLNATSGDGQPKITDGKTGKRGHDILQDTTKATGNDANTKSIPPSTTQRYTYWTKS
jgi:hypothetical protein